MRGEELRSPGGHDLADGRARAASRRAGDFDRVAGQKPLAIVVVGAMLCTLFLTRYLMPVLYSFFPAPAGHTRCDTELILGSHYTDRFLHLTSPKSDEVPHQRSRGQRPLAAGSKSRSGKATAMKINGKLLLALILLALGATGWVLNRWIPGPVAQVWKQISQVTSPSEEGPPDKSWLESSAARSRSKWDRTLTLTSAQIEAIGLRTELVEAQTEPTQLRLFGTTDYDPATVTVVRTQFDSRVDQVLVDLGSPVKKGDPLLELFSTDLAEAKSNYEAAISQWERDKKVLEYKTSLANENALPKTQVIEAENDEAQSGLKKKLARDKLLVYGLTDKEIENASKEDGVQKAKMILRSRADGVVVLRSVVIGNYYTSADLLMTIAPLDHLWVRGSVSELDAEKVAVGQRMKVVFPFSDRTIDGEVKYVDKAIDPDSRSAKFRTSIANPEGKLKAGMFVRVLVEIPPRKGRTLIHRAAMVTVDRFDYVFIRRPGKTNQFERRQIFTAKESHDFVIVAEASPDHAGLAPGQEVVTTGSLILQQLFEDREMTDGGFLVARDAQKDGSSFEQPTLSILTSPRDPR